MIGPILIPGLPRQTLIVLAEIRGHGHLGVGSRLQEVHRHGTLAELQRGLDRASKGRLVQVRTQSDQTLWIAEPERFVGAGLGALLSDLAGAFDQGLEDLVSANTCPCPVCQGTSRLRLKLLVHLGEISLLEDNAGAMAGGEGLALLRRLEESVVLESGYVMVTEAACQEPQGGIRSLDGFEAMTIHPASNGVCQVLVKALEREVPAESGNAGWLPRLRLLARKTLWDLRYKG